MDTVVLETRNLTLHLQTPAEIRMMIAGMMPDEKAQLSAQWLALVADAPVASPWIHGFTIKQPGQDAVIGQCGFKGPPTPDGMVEIAYGIEPTHQNKGYATEAAAALATYAFSHADIRVVRAHTLPEANASTRVLIKCGFHKVGAVTDPEDGLVWRWEQHAPA